MSLRWGVIRAAFRKADAQYPDDAGALQADGERSDTAVPRPVRACVDGVWQCEICIPVARGGTSVAGEDAALARTDPGFDHPLSRHGPTKSKYGPLHRKDSSAG